MAKMVLEAGHCVLVWLGIALGVIFYAFVMRVICLMASLEQITAFEINFFRSRPISYVGVSDLQGRYQSGGLCCPCRLLSNGHSAPQ